MTETETVTEVSTPVETIAEETSVDVVPETSDTTTQEPEAVEVAAETETETQVEQGEQKLYANKYKNLEDFEKGYKELQGAFAKSQEKYNELIRQQEEQARQNQQALLQRANQRGFNTVEEADISDKVAQAEFNYYWQGQNTINPESAQEVQGLLAHYFHTGNRAYLEEAKRYYTSDFIESVAVAKQSMEQGLRNQYQQTRNAEHEKAQQELANTLKNDFAEFLGDLQENTGKAQALEMFCKADFINSPEDMKVFEHIYSEIEKSAIAKYLKEQEAQKVINETKEKAVIGNNVSTGDIKVNSITREQLLSDPEMYKKAIAKYGEEKVDEIIMKG